MTRFLILPDVATADARSRSAWTAAPGDAITVRLWDVIPDLADGRAALLIPAETEEALTDAERAALVTALPAGATAPA